MVKDRFSAQSEQYLKYRPKYPSSIIRKIVKSCLIRNTAWDCATGNGQIASELSEHFHEVYATDISEKQLSSAVQRENVHYKITPAEKTNFKTDMFDLITVGQALHWFDHLRFNLEVNRVLKQGGSLAILGYRLIRFELAEINECIDWFYSEVVGDFWDEERKHVDREYRDISFPFGMNKEEFRIEISHSRQSLINLVRTWSGAKIYHQKTGGDPIPIFEKRLSEVFPDEKELNGYFPGFMFIGKKP